MRAPRDIRRIVVFTSSDIREPRGVKHTELLAKMYPAARVELIDTAPLGSALVTPERLRILSNVTRITSHSPHRRAAPVRTLVARARTRLAREVYRRVGHVSLAALSLAAVVLRAAVLRRPAADLYVGHNVDALPVLAELAQKRGVPVVYDSMEFYSDMGMSALEGEIIEAVERACLPRCNLVLTASEDISSALEGRYGVSSTQPLYNAAATTPLEGAQKPPGLHLYWRNTIIGLGPRGLQDVLQALTKLPPDVRLYLQGGQGPSTDEVRRMIDRLQLRERVELLAPYAPHEAIHNAARHHVGLCLERDENENHRLTVSNKLFDYHMAGLAVVVSSLPGLRRIVERSGGGLLYQPGDADDLARKLQQLHDSPSLREQLSARARAYALREGNEEHEMATLEKRLRQLLET